jgi:hypothetical protein
MTAPAAPTPVSRRGQLTAAALSALVLATVTGVGLAVWSSGGPAPVTEKTTAEGEGTVETRAEEGLTKQDSFTGGTAGIGLATATARPALVTSEKNYTAADLEGFRNDVGTRLDFYSTYWYPNSGGASQPATLERLQADLTDDLAEQAAAAGQDPAELEQAVATVMEQAGDEPILPCYAERARIEGKDAWLISASGPEDYLLFSDQERPPAMVLASLGGEESLKISESVLRELAALLSPSSSGNVPLIPASTLQSQDNAAGDGAITGEENSTPEGDEETTPEAEQSQVEEDFQSFLRQLAAQGTSLDLVSALEGLNYEQILLLLQGDWSGLAAGGVNLSDFLTPPQRLWAVDCVSGDIVWGSE